MKLVSKEAFEKRTAFGWDPKMDDRFYLHLSFSCACGDEHEWREAFPIRELPLMRMVLLCPEDQETMTCVRVKGMFRTRLISKFGLVGD